MTHPWFEGARTPRVLAHRGFVPPDAEGIIENSLAAIAAAHGAGAVYVESDCHVTSDGRVVLFHDDSLVRVTGDPRPISAVSFAELERLMADRGAVAELGHALDAFPSIRFNLDVKATAAALPTGRIVARHADRVLLTSFSDARREAALDASRRAGGRPATSGGTATITRAVAAAATGSRALTRRVLRGIDALQVPVRHRGIRVATPRLVRAAHDAGVEVHVWTIDEAPHMRELLDLGVDGIITDRVDVALRVVAARD